MPKGLVPTESLVLKNNNKVNIMSGKIVAFLITLEGFQDRLNSGLISEQEYINCVIDLCNQYYTAETK
jgi:hypothetical protein